MTVSSENSNFPYAGNGVTTNFAFSNVVYEQTSLKVVLTNSSGVETLQALTTNYTVAIAGDNSSATVTMLTAPASGEILTITRNEPLTQATDFITGGDLSADTLEQTIDRVVLQNQQQEERSLRAIRVPDSETESDAATVLPTVANRSSKFFAWDANGDIVPASTVSATAVVSTFMETVLDDTTATAARNTLGVDADSLEYTFSTTTADADPGAGTLRFNNATPASVTQIFIDDSPANITGLDLGTLFAQSDGSRILISQRSNSTKFLLGLITAETDGTGYWKLTITVEDSGTLPDNGADLTVKILPGGVPIDLSNLSQSTFLGRKDSAGTGDIQSMTAAEAATAMLPIDDAEALLHKTGNTAITQTHDVDAYTASRTVTWPDESLDFGEFGMRLLATYSPSAVASVDITSVITTTYSSYMVYYDLVPATDNVRLVCRLSTDNGSTWVSTAAAYKSQVFNADSTTLSGSRTDATEGYISASGVGSASGEHISGKMLVSGATNASLETLIGGEFVFHETSSLTRTGTGGIKRAAAEDNDALQLFFSSGDIASGEIRVYGVK